jgi:hypothetical protein
MVEKPLPNLKKSQEKILAMAKQIKLARQLERFKCSHKNGCSACQPFEKILRGEAEFVGIDELRSDIYVLDKTDEERKKASIIL